MENENKSIGWIVGALALVVAGAGWGFLAADFFQNGPDSGGAGRANFFVNAVTQLPDFPRVMSHAWATRAWVFVVLGVLEAGVVVLGLVMKKIESEIEGKPKPKSAAGRRR